MTTPDYKALCAELTDALTAHGPMPGALPLLIRARAALAEPAPDTDDVLRLAAIIRDVDGNHDKGAAALAEAILEHSGYPAARAALAEGEEASNVEGDAHELWALAQLAPGEGIEDGVDRIARFLPHYGSTQPRPVPVAEPADDVRYEFSVFNGEDEWQAGGEAPTLEQAQREGRHYLAQYEADGDGPYRLELREVRVLPAHAIPTPEGTDD